jgi:hypothetical protein
MSKRVYPLIESNGDSVTVTAYTTVEAQEAAATALGTDCTITHVERVQQGGLGGFFATELVRLTARPALTSTKATDDMDAVLASADELVSSLRTRVPQFADRLFEEWERELDAPADLVPQRVTAPPAPSMVEPMRTAAEPTRRTPDLMRDIVEADTSWVSSMFLDEASDDADDDFLLSAVPRLAPAIRPLVPREPKETISEPAPVSAPALRMSPTSAPIVDGWSEAALRALGVPDRIIEDAVALAPETEGQWIVALMSALRDYCGPVPMMSSVMVGPAAANLARQLKLVSVMSDELADSVSSVAFPNATVHDLSKGLHGRHVHLVVGGSWQHLVRVPANVVSAAGARDLLVALRTAAAWGAVLGWYWVGPRYERIDEFAVVELIRTALRSGEPAILS